MPFSSAEISASIGAFQQNSMNNQAYSQMIGMGGQGAMADRMAGGAMSRAAGIGGPLAMGALGLMGLDPMGMGIKAGISAFSGGSGIVGAGMAGLGTFGLATGGVAAAGFAGSQVLQGAQQQSQLNSAMRNSFSFQNQNGGTGFNRSDLGNIGSMMRGMTHQFGPEGQMTGMSELTNLASNMGKMGMATGVKDAQEFSRKFREMMTTLKSVAKELGTSLEEAQQFVQAQRSSGIFAAADQTKFALKARGAALSGGLALSEVTGMASIGSQISRSVGGLGRQGAFGGMKAIGQVGSAMQIGALSEEDIYNSTGLMGAEGRQAMASNMMAQTGSFLKSGRGRYFLASVAGKNGNLDEESVQNWMAGGMSVGDTKSQANNNLHKVGRGNFIRNEGRLRGAVLEKFGAMADTMAYQQWLDSRGYDPNNMDDKSMLAFQRFSGKGRDDADDAIKMVQKLPEMLTQQRQSAGDDKRAQALEHHRQTTGIEGMKHQLAQVREGIQGKLQEVGQNLMTSGSDMIEQWWNGLMGTYERRLSGDVDKVWQSAKLGGKGGKALQSMLNTGSGASLFGSGTVSGDPMSKAMDKSKQLQSAAEIGGIGTAQTTEFAKQNRDWIRDAYTTTLSKVTSERRISEFGSTLKARADSGDKQAQSLYATWKGSSAVDRAGMLGSIEQQVGIGKDVSLGKSWELPDLGIDRGMFRTVREGDVAVGRAIMGEEAYRQGGRSKDSTLAKLARGTKSIIGGLLDPLGLNKDMQNLASGIGGAISGADPTSAAIGAYTRSEEGAGIIRGLATGDKSSISDAQDKIQEINNRETKSELSKEDEGIRTVLQQSMLGAEFLNTPAGSSTKELQIKADKLLGREPGTTTVEDLARFRDQARGLAGDTAKENVMHLTERARSETLEQSEAYKRMGLVTENKDGSLELNSTTAKAVGKAGSHAAQLAMEAINVSGRLGTDPEQNRKTLIELADIHGQEYDDISNMSISEKRKLARGAAGTELGALAGESTMRENRLKGSMGRGRGVVGGIGSQLGLDLSKDELAGMKGKDAAQIAAFLASKAGITKDEDFTKTLAESVSAAQHGKIGSAADILNKGIAQSKEAQDKLGKNRQDPATETAEAVKQSNKYLMEIAKASGVSNSVLQGIESKVGKTDTEAPPGAGRRGG